MLYPLGLPSKETFSTLQMGEMVFKRRLEKGQLLLKPDKERCLELFFSSLDPSAPTSCVTSGQLSRLFLLPFLFQEKLAERGHALHLSGDFSTPGGPVLRVTCCALRGRTARVLSISCCC